MKTIVQIGPLFRSQKCGGALTKAETETHHYEFDGQLTVLEAFKKTFSKLFYLGWRPKTEKEVEQLIWHNSFTVYQV